MSPPVSRALALAALCLAPCDAGQSGFETLQDLIAEALRANPEVQAARHRYQASRQRASQEGALPEPTISLGYASVGRPYPFAGLGTEPMANAGIMLTQEFPAPGKRRLRAGMAHQESRAAMQQYQAVQLQVVSRVKQTYYRLAYAHALEEVVERNQRLLEQILRVSEARYAAGLAPQQDVFKAQTQLSLLEARREEVAEQRRLRQAEINQLLGRPARSSPVLPAPLVAPRGLPPLADLLEAASRQSPALAERENAIAGAELAVNLARKDYYPDWALSGGYFTMGRMGSMYMLRADFRLPLFWGRKQRPALIEQHERLLAERRSYEAEALSLRLRIEQEYLAAERAARVARIYSQAAVPQAGLTLEASLSAYQSGTVDMLTVLSNFDSLLQLEINYLTELVSYYISVSRLEELTGEALLK